MSVQPRSDPSVSAPLSTVSRELEQILITEQLTKTVSHPPPFAAENGALKRLAKVMANAPEQLPDTLLELAMELCGAASAGLSLIESAPGKETIFRWTNLAGVLKPHVGGFTPRNFSPCGVTLERKSAQLFAYPERYFQYLGAAGVPIVEGLVIPLAGENPLGTLWIVSHDPHKHFDGEDLRIMTSLADFTSAALRMNMLLESERRALESAEREIEKSLAVQKALRESEEFTRRVLESTSDCIKVLDLDFHIKYMNAVGMEIMEVEDFSDCSDANWMEFWQEQDRASIMKAVEQAKSDGKGAFHGFCPTMKGTAKWWDVVITPVKNTEGEIVKLLCTSRDVTSRKEAENELQRSHERLEWQVKARTSELQQQILERRRAEESLRILTGRLLQLRDEEQRRLARELHDSVGQMLAAISMNISIVSTEDLSEAARRAVAQNAELVNQVSNEIRTISHLLHPPLLDEVGLSSGIRWFVEQFSERSRIEVELYLDDEFGRLPRDTETALFRLVQEALTNIHRHAESVSAAITVKKRQNQITLEISDCGRGIPQEKILELERGIGAGLGLAGMRERVQHLGGTFEIRSGPEGTTVRAEVPLAWEEARRSA